jgi:hypothetical protein
VPDSALLVASAGCRVGASFVLLKKLEEDHAVLRCAVLCCAVVLLAYHERQNNSPRPTCFEAAAPPAAAAAAATIGDGSLAQSAQNAVRKSTETAPTLSCSLPSAADRTCQLARRMRAIKMCQCL